MGFHPFFFCPTGAVLSIFKKQARQNFIPLSKKKNWIPWSKQMKTSPSRPRRDARRSAHSVLKELHMHEERRKKCRDATQV